MAQFFGFFSIGILLLSLANSVNAVHTHELESMISALRATGYNLFGNAITTSDINYEVLSGTAFTIFAPTDSTLFSLDMTAAASDYITTLHYHVVPRRFSLSELRTFASGVSLRTLDPTRDIVLEKLRSLANEIITVDGVAIVVPDLYYGREIVAHGLGGIISFRSHTGSGQQPPMNMTGNNSNETSGSPPQVNLHVAPPPEVMVHSGGFEPSSNDEIDYHPATSPIPETGTVDGLSPVNSPGFDTPAFFNQPESANSTSNIPPTNASSPTTLTYPDSGGRSAAPPSSVSYSQRRHYSHSSGGSRSYSPGTYRRLGLDEEGQGGSNGVSVVIQALTPEEDLRVPSVPLPEYYWPFNETNVHCPLTEDQMADTMTCIQT